MKGTSTLIDGLSGNSNDNTNSTSGIADIATDVLVGSTRVTGEVLENQPVIADTGKEITAGAVDIGSKLAGEVSNNPEIVEGVVTAGKGAIEVGKTVSNLFQGLFGWFNINLKISECVKYCIENKKIVI